MRLSNSPLFSWKTRILQDRILIQRIRIFFSLAIALGLQTAPVQSLPAADRPNIVLFFADDLGWNGLHCYGSPLHATPNLDRLAEQGIQFTDAYSACTVCSPSRAALITGKYPARLHLTDFIAGQDNPHAKLKIPEWTKWLRHEEITIAEALKPTGYKTAQIGKWHLSPKDKRAATCRPVDHGFDRQIEKPASKGYFMTKGAGNFKQGDFTTDYLADETAALIDDWKDQPFFLYFAFDVPHTPIQGKQKWVDHYQKMIEPDAIHNNPTYAAMIHSLDEAVGTVLEALKRNSLEEKTVVIFTSDNGGLSHKFGKPTGFTRNDPMRRGKGAGYEGGVRVPMIVKWPGVAPEGGICAEPVIGCDLFPTVLEIAGGRDATKALTVDGKSMVGLFNDPEQTLEREAIYWHYPHYHAGGFALPGEPTNGPYGAIRSGPWKLIEYFEDGRLELYNLSQDDGESKDLSRVEAERASKMHHQLKAWRKSVGAQMPTANPAYDAAKAR